MKIMSKRKFFECIWSDKLDFVMMEVSGILGRVKGARSAASEVLMLENSLGITLLGAAR
jgi:hypothetical protein